MKTIGAVLPIHTNINTYIHTHQVFDNYAVTVMIGGEPYTLGVFDTAGMYTLKCLYIVTIYVGRICICLDDILITGHLHGSYIHSCVTLGLPEGDSLSVYPAGTNLCEFLVIL